MLTQHQSLAETLEQAHSALREDLECLLEPVDTPTEIHERLVKARVHILDHFRFEELGGYLDAIRLRHPRLDRAIQHLLEEHGQLMQTLESLIAQAAGFDLSGSHLDR